MTDQRFAILGSAAGWYSRDLQRAARSLPIQLEIFSWNDIQASLAKPLIDARPYFNPSEFDALLVRSMPMGSLEQIIFRMNALAHFSNGPQIFNSPRSLEIAIDKYLCLAHLERAGLRIPASVICQTAEQAMEGFNALNQTVVVKPIFGGEGRGILQVDDADLAWRTFRTLERTQSVIYLQEQIAHAGFDTRILFVGEQWFAIERHHDTDWRCNLSRGGKAIAAEPTESQLEMAQSAKAVSGCEICGVDLLASKNGTDYILEVNAVPGWKGLASTLNVDIARTVLEFLKRKLDTGQSMANTRQQQV